MYEDRDRYGEPGWLRVLRWLSASFRLGRFFDVEVRVYWFALVLMPLILWDGFSGNAVRVLLVTVLLYLVIWTHEMGHILAGRRHRIHTPLITLSPLGGLAHMASPPPGPRAEAVVSLAGPAVHLLWLGLAWGLSLLFDTERHAWDPGIAGVGAMAVEALRLMNLGLLLFNLLPCFPMDGGRVFRAFLAARMHPNRATLIAARVGLVGAAAFAVWSFTQPRFQGGILFLIAISNVLACLAEMRAARHVATPYQHDPHESWQSDPDAWKGGARREEVRRPGPLARWRQRRREAAAAREREAHQALDQELDRILARVSEVGLSGLTEAERKTLAKASAAKRRPG